jgi:hypothetical protein
VLHLKRLSELLAGVDRLRAARIPSAKLVPALLALDPTEIASLPEEQRSGAVREKLFPSLVTETLGKQARQALEEVLGRAQDQADRVALIAGRMFLDLWLSEKKAPHMNPAWEAIFGMSVLDAFFEGHILSGLVRGSFSIDEGQVAKSFASAFSRSEVTNELEKLGLEKPEAPELAREYARIARETTRTYLLGFDSLLHLVRGNHELAAKNIRPILTNGLTTSLRDEVLSLFEESFKNDMTTPLVGDLTDEIVRRLEAFKSDTAPKDDEKRVALTALVSLRALPDDQNLVLRSIYLGSFDIYKTVAPMEEMPFIRRIWAGPTDRWALEEYERFLLERRHKHRAARVHRFLTEVRKEAREAEEKKTEAAG